MCMRIVKERQTFISLGKTRSRTIRTRERRGLNHVLFEEVHRNKNQESPVSIRLPSQIGEREDNISNVGDVEEITSKVLPSVG